MKTILRTALIFVLLVVFCTQAAFASSFITIYGKTDSPLVDLTFIALKKGADAENISPTDITYLLQEKVGSDGKFKIKLPIGEEFDYYTNNSSLNIFDSTSQKDIAYVSSNGDNTDGKTPQTAFTSLEEAYKNLFRIDEIVLMENTSYIEPPEHDGMLTLKGNTPDIVLTIPDTVSILGDLTFDNLTLTGNGTAKNNSKGNLLYYVLTVYANGNSLVFGKNFTCANQKHLDVYGGMNHTDFTGDTDVRIYGGTFQYVYGGGHYGKVTGNTNVIFGGTANKGQSINDSASNASLAMVHGGGHGAMVTGETNVTIQDEAITKYLIGAGYASSVDAYAPVTNIYIKGGKVMNVYGGSFIANITDVTTNITMTGGLVESIFGGSNGKNLNGDSHTNITILGGDVSRRVYSGCYNDWNWSWESAGSVIGTTTLRIGPDAEIATGTELSSSNKLNSGIFCGSRISTSIDLSSEHNTLIFLDDSYSKFSSKIGDITGWDDEFKSFADYTVKATAGGEVIGTTSGGTVKVVPDKGYSCTVDGVKCTTETTTVKANSEIVFTLEKDFVINDLDATKNSASVSGSADITAENTANEPEPILCVVVFEEASGKMLSCDIQPASTAVKEFEIGCTLENDKTYIVKAMIWNANQKPLTSVYSINL